MDWKPRDHFSSVLDVVTTRSGLSEEELLDPQRTDPNDIQNLKEAAMRIAQAIKSHEHISVMGDYDVDGITSTAILYFLLTKFGASPIALSQLVLNNARFTVTDGTPNGRLITWENLPGPYIRDWFDLLYNVHGGDMRQPYCREYASYDPERTSTLPSVSADWSYDNTPELDACLDCIEQGISLHSKNETLDFLTQRHYLLARAEKFRTKRMDAIISEQTGRPFFGDQFVIDGYCKDMALSHGLSEREARDVALIIATIQRVNAMEFDNLCSPTTYPSKIQEKQTPARLPEDMVPLSQYQAQERRVKDMDAELQSLRHQLNELQKLLAERDTRIDENEELIDTYEKILQEYDREEQGTTAENDVNTPDVSFPATTEKSIVVYGGFDNFRASLAELIPDINIVPHTRTSIDMTPMRNADIIFIQVNYLSHSAYYAIRDFAKAHGIPCKTLKTAGPKSCARYIIEEVSKL